MRLIIVYNDIAVLSVQLFRTTECHTKINTILIVVNALININASNEQTDRVFR